MKKVINIFVYICATFIPVIYTLAQAPPPGTYLLSTSGPLTACSSTSGTLSVYIETAGPYYGTMNCFQKGQVVNGVFQVSAQYVISPTENTFNYTINTTGTVSYRAIVKNASNELVPTNIITFTVSENVTAGSVGISPDYTDRVKAYCHNASGTISIGPSSGSLVWQQKIGTQWVDINPLNTTNTLNFSGITNSTDYRVSVSNGACVFYREANIIVYKPGTLTAVASQVLEGEKATLVMGADGRATGIHPEYSYDNGTTWKAFEFSNGYVGTAWAAEFVIHRNTKFRFLMDMGGICASEYSNAVDVTMLPYTNSHAPIIINSANLQKQQQVIEQGIKNVNAVDALTTSQKRQVISYLDGAGRVLQQNVTKATPTTTPMDIIAFHDYDSRGMETKEYLPYVSLTSDGSYALTPQTSQQSFYTNGTADKVTDSSHPFAETIIEKSPLGRPMEIGSVGATWQPGGGHTQKITFSNNLPNEVRLFVQDGISTGYYAANDLSKVESTDPDQKKKQVFKDKAGKIVLKREQLDETVSAIFTPWLETYYIYNTDGSLQFIISPKGVELLKTTGWAITPDFKNQYVHEFVYDEQGRVVEKKIPDQAPQYYCYDRLNRIVLFQDGNLRASNKWVFIKYDRSGRPVLQGLYTNTVQTTRTGIQTNVINPLYAVDTDPYYESRSADMHGYTNVSFPTTSTEIQAVNYYDNYDFNGDGANEYSYVAQGLQNENTPDPNVTGLATGSKRIVLGTTTWLYSYVFYDAQGRMIQARSNNHLSSDIDNIITIVYDFEGKVKIQKQYHNAGGGKMTTVINKLDYDNMGRLIRTYQNNNAAPSDQLIAQYEYNALGQLVDKKLHEITSGSNTFLQSVDFRYSIQGWLTSINNAQITNDNSVTNDETTDFFGMELLYEKTQSGLTSATDVLYNGNISAVKWKAPGTASGIADQRSYKFTYDKSNRFKTAISQISTTATSWTKEASALDESVTAYDLNGNILGLQRRQRKHTLTVSGSSVTVSYGNELIDNLTYTYATTSADQLLKVTDATNRAEGFDNGSSGTANDFTYDVMGSLLTDKNKGITTNISYNEFGKPLLVIYADGRKVEYVYDAAGTKLNMKRYEAGGVLKSTTDYVGSFVYENGVLNFFSSPEGRVVRNASSGALEYQYAIADHQGNTRVVFSSVNPSETHLATFENISNDAQKFKNLTTNTFYWVNAPSVANNTPGGTRSLRLNSTYNATGNAPGIAAAKSLSVAPGDVVDLEVYAYYTGTSGFGNTSLSLTSLVAAVAGSVTTGMPATEANAITNGINSAYTAFGTAGNQSDAAPSAYLNYVLLDKNYKLLDMGWQPVPTTANGAKQKLSFTPRNIKEPGYMYVYLSYEGDGANWVYFDDLKVTHTKSNIVQYNEYYPFGLLTSNSWTRENSRNDFLYNAGSELNQTTGWYETAFRGYDPALGRFMQVDPMATKYASLSGYHYAYNNPVMNNDPSGADPSWTAGGCQCDNGSMNWEAWEADRRNQSAQAAALAMAPRDPYLAQAYWNAVASENNFLAQAQANARRSQQAAADWQAELYALSQGVTLLPEVQITDLREGRWPSWWGEWEQAGNNHANEGVGQPGFAESLIPIWGSGRAAIDDFQNGRYGWAAFNTALAVSDVFLVKAIATGIAKGGAKMLTKSYSYWSSARRFYGKKGFAQAGQQLHHWAWARNGASKGEGFAWWAKNQMWNLMPMESQAFHTAVHGLGPNAFNGLERLYYGTPLWFKAGLLGTGGDVANQIR
jgi:RHS repeat-associated protein